MINEFINNKVRLNDLANSLGITSSALRQHVDNPKTGLGINSEKFGQRQTGDVLLDVDSVFSFLEWMSSKSRRVSQETINNTRDQIRRVN